MTWTARPERMTDAPRPPALAGLGHDDLIARDQLARVERSLVALGDPEVCASLAVEPDCFAVTIITSRGR